jgi:hypothetical protein
MRQQPEEKKQWYTVTYRATVNVAYDVEATSPEAAYRIADETDWNEGEIESDEIHAITVSFEDENGKLVHLDEDDLNLEEDDEPAT